LSGKKASWRRFVLALLCVVLVAFIPVLFGPFLWMGVLTERLGLGTEELNNTTYNGVELKSWPQAIAMECLPDQSLCSIEVPTHELKLRVEPKDLPALKPLSFSLVVSGVFQIDQPSQETKAGFEVMAGWIEGRDMFMGQHPLSSSITPSGNFTELAGMIPVCITGSDMVWRLTVQYRYDGSDYAVYADLSTQAHNLNYEK
jgi:hypothetical protein